MCGIFGAAGFSRAELTGRIELALNRLSHRGPDAAGSWMAQDLPVALAHRRLSIIDLSTAAQQPMLSDDGTSAIAFNGEVYNYRALRADLEAVGHRFRTASDTEVILVAYLRWGEACLQRLNGMFALAIFDGRPAAGGATLFLARDRAGKKPLYYRHHATQFEFASELKALAGQTKLDARALNFYLALGYVPGELCLAQGVRKLPPGCAARFHIAAGRLDVWRYWRLPDPSRQRGVSGDELADHAERLFNDAVGLRLISDVPLGVLLSGGLDSSLVMAAAAARSTRPVKAFTVSFPGTRVDEAEHAAKAARHFDAEHHVLRVERPSLRTLDEFAPLVDEPIADSSLLPAFMVSRLTRRHVTVALGGDGGDEVFGGYTDYPVALSDARRLRWVPRPALATLARIATLLPAGVRGRNRLASWRHGPLQQMIWGRPYFDITLRRRVLRRDFRQAGDFTVDEPELSLLTLFRTGHDGLDSMMRTHFGSILPDDFLVKIDRASMAVGLEMRAPFLDHRLVEFAYREIPSEWKVHAGQTRRIERLLARRMLPAGLDFNRKQGFSIPLDEWLRAEACAHVRETMPFLPEAIDRTEVERLINGHMRGRANGARLFALTMLGLAAKNNGWT